MRLGLALAAAATAGLLMPIAPVRAQEERPAGSVQVTPSNAELRAGYYDMVLTLTPSTCLTQAVGGTSRGVVEVTAGRRDNLVVHLEKLSTLFAGPIAVAIDGDSHLAFAGRVPISIGGVRIGANGQLDGAFERGRDRFEATFELAARLCKIGGTLEGVKTEAPPPPAPEPAPAGPGASVFTDGYIAPPPDPAPPGASPLIAGRFATTLTVDGRRCIRDVSGRWNRDIEVGAAPTISVPLNEYNNLFSGPAVLKVSGLDLSQTASVPLSLGGSVPARFTGGFSADGSRVDLKFEVRAPLCSLDGRIEGTKI